MKKLVIPALMATTLVLSACDRAKEQIGLTRRIPDEFAVVKRAPLEIPADLSALPTPQPGAPRPQEQSPEVQARNALISGGENVVITSTPTKGEEALLARVGEADPAIRQKVNAEADTNAESSRPVVKRLLNMGADTAPATIVDAPEEAKRIIDNKAKGEAATKGETPTIDD